jgi:hypothetical protein
VLGKRGFFHYNFVSLLKYKNRLEKNSRAQNVIWELLFLIQGLVLKIRI